MVSAWPIREGVGMGAIPWLVKANDEKKTKKCSGATKKTYVP